MKLKNTELKDAFKSMTSSQLSDYKFLSNFIFDKIGVKLNTSKLSITEKMDCWGGLLCKQYPDELAKLLVLLYKYKNNINSFCEIGSEKGGTFYTIDSFLRAINPNMGKSLATDRSGKILNLFNEYRIENPQAQFLRINSINFKPDQNYDFCFIDGDHSYEGCKQDFYLMQNYSKIIALHDIKFKYTKIGVHKLWDEIDIPKVELLNEDNRFPVSLGIGIIFLKEYECQNQP